MNAPPGAGPLRPIANFLFEVGMLRRTPRSGLQFLGSGTDSVAEHILRVSYLAFVMGRIVPQVDSQRLLLMCMLHDLPEARTGDLNYENKKYVTVDEPKAIRDLAAPLPFGAIGASPGGAPALAARFAAAAPRGPRGAGAGIVAILPFVKVFGFSRRSASRFHRVLTRTGLAGAMARRALPRCR